MKINVMTNYSLVLFNVVQGLSQWDVHTGKHNLEYFEKEFGLTDEDQLKLKEFADFRRNYSWSRDSDFLYWAYLGLPDGDEFSVLTPIVKYFENRVSKDGLTLKEICEKRFEEINKYSNVGGIWSERDIEKFLIIVERSRKIFDITYTLTDLNVFLMASMNLDTSGGANGWAISVEVPANLEGEKKYSEEEIKARVKLYLEHEGLHLQVPLSKAFNLKDPFFDQAERVANFPDGLDSFSEEVVVHSLVDCLLNGIDPQATLARYENMVEQFPWIKMYIPIWQGINEVLPVIKDVYGFDEDGKLKNFMGEKMSGKEALPSSVDQEKICLDRITEAMKAAIIMINNGELSLQKV
jgi:hypothetical protein